MKDQASLNPTPSEAPARMGARDRVDMRLGSGMPMAKQHTLHASEFESIRHILCMGMSINTAGMHL